MPIVSATNDAPLGAQQHVAGIRVTSTPSALGAIITCGDLRHADPATIQAVRQAGLDHLVVVVRGQALSDADLIKIGRNFGECDLTSAGPESPLVAMGKAIQGGKFAEFPEITVVSNVVENGIAIGGVGGGELGWHTHPSRYLPPPPGSLLYSLAIPPAAGGAALSPHYSLPP